MNAPLAVTLTTTELEELVAKSVTGIVNKLLEERQSEVMNLEECAAFLQRHKKVVMSVLVKEKGLPVHYISERDPRFKRTEVLNWLSTLPSVATKKEDE